MRPAIHWLRRRADNVAVGLLTAMFLSFVLQIVTRYVLRHPLGWTMELCMMSWLWLVFWSCAFLLRDEDHVRFDMFYSASREKVKRALALISALAILIALAAALPPTVDYVTFMKIKKSAILGIRLDLVFGVYIVFAVALIVRYALRAWVVMRGGSPDMAAADTTQ